jgi:hypothetical protein
MEEPAFPIDGLYFTHATAIPHDFSTHKETELHLIFRLLQKAKVGAIANFLKLNNQTY